MLGVYNESMLNMTPLDETKETPITVRFPKELHLAIKALAETERRSFNAQVIVLLEAALAARPR